MTQVPEKPEALILHDSMVSTHSLYWPGGLGNQPWVLMQEFAICRHERRVFLALDPKLSEDLDE